MSTNTEEYDQENPFGLEIESNFHLIRRQVTISLLHKYVADGMENRILDVGCGKGHITKFIRQQYTNAIVDAWDISEKAIQHARAEIEGVNFVVADATEFLPVGVLYDAIVMNNIYEHVENPLLLLNNLKNLLNNDGIFVISTPNRYHIKNIFRIVLGLGILVPSYHVTEYSIGQIYDHHAYCGLTVKEVVTPEFKYEKFKLINVILIQVLQPLIVAYLNIRKSRNKLGSLLFIISKVK
jgi:2-polyprenyl-3-methyl-5-hydroxy-6-metoxy-1,4-benzoquinol methylase